MDPIDATEPAFSKCKSASPSIFTSSNLSSAQGPSPSLSDAICAVLASLKRREKTANMENILQGIQTDFREIPAPKDFLQLVHKTLGGLIKARRVY